MFPQPVKPLHIGRLIVANGNRFNIKSLVFRPVDGILLRRRRNSGEHAELLSLKGWKPRRTVIDYYAAPEFSGDCRTGMGGGKDIDSVFFHKIGQLSLAKHILQLLDGTVPAPQQLLIPVSDSDFTIAHLSDHVRRPVL